MVWLYNCALSIDNPCMRPNLTNNVLDGCTNYGVAIVIDSVIAYGNRGIRGNLG